MTDIILVPGMWLDGSSWERVTPALEAAGHRPRPLTLPGMEARDLDRSSIGLRDHVEAVVGAIDSLDPDDPVVLVGHSAGAAIVHAAVDARPDRVARAIHVGGFPTADGDALGADWGTGHGEVPLPDWSAFGDEDLAGLDADARAAFRERAIPTPERVVTEPQRLADPRRHEVPVTVVCTEFGAADLRGWIADGEPAVREYAAIRSVDLVDLPTGHWPQFTRPTDLAEVIVAAIDDLPGPARSGSAEPAPDAVTEPVPDPLPGEPPIAGTEVESLLGSLERQRATFAWKCSGLDAAGMQATVGASTMTLGGLVKHLTFVEDVYFTYRLAGRSLGEAWPDRDWEDPDWDWHTAADDPPEELLGRWEQAVERSRSAVRDALVTDGLGQRARGGDWDEPPSLRRILFDLVEEYARHVGHADLIRESVDGLVGEDPPRDDEPEA